MTLVALVRDVSASIVNCELTHLSRVPIDFAAASRQHDAYSQALAALGCVVEHVPVGADMPDSVFIEDTAVVLDEVAIITRPGAESRRGETPAVEFALASYREVRRMEAPATLDGGDVLSVGRAIYVGVSGRTNAAAVDQLRASVSPFGFSVEAIEVREIGRAHV